MASRNSTKLTEKRLAKALGAKRVIPIADLPSGGPLDLLALRAQVASRIRSTGGRPTDPAWNMQRLVPFRKERWRQLVDLATRLSSDQRKVSPAQVAAMLIERALQQVHK